MAGTVRLSKLARECNVGIHTIVEFLHKKGFDIDSNPNTKVDPVAVQLLEQEYKVDISLKKESEKIILKSHRPKKEVLSIDDADTEVEEDEEDEAPVVEKPKEFRIERPVAEKPKVLGRRTCKSKRRTEAC
jgi:translation initiation factor IF-2